MPVETRLLDPYAATARRTQQYRLLEKKQMGGAHVQFRTDLPIYFLGTRKSIGVESSTEITSSHPVWQSRPFVLALPTGNTQAFFASGFRVGLTVETDSQCYWRLSI